MKIFIVSKYKNNNASQEKLVDIIEQQCEKSGHKIFTGYKEIDKAKIISAKNWMPFVKKHIESSDILIVIYEKGLEGGLIEEGIAYGRNIPIWFLFKKGETVSSSAIGCADKKAEFEGLDDLRDKLEEFLKSAY